MKDVVKYCCVPEGGMGLEKFAATSDHSVGRQAGNMKMPSMHYHNSYELYYLEAGSREYFVEDKLFRVCAGDFVLIAPGKLHRTGGDYGIRTLVIFTESFLEKLYTPETVASLLRCFQNLKIVPSESQQETCKQLLKMLSASNGDTEFGLALGMLLEQLQQCGSEEVEDDYVGTIVEYINANFAGITSIGQIAEHFYISKFHLCRVFKNAMQMTVVSYLNQIRIKNARHYLEFSDADVGEISQNCGFNTTAYFSNVFKRQTGLSPSEYRRKFRSTAAENKA